MHYVQVNIFKTRKIFKKKCPTLGTVSFLDADNAILVKKQLSKLDEMRQGLPSNMSEVTADSLG